jgi:hypothetical protein
MKIEIKPQKSSTTITSGPRGQVASDITNIFALGNGLAGKIRLAEFQPRK